MTTRAVDYARISVHDKNVPKVENQHAELRKLAASRNLGRPREFEDDGISASNGAHRPGFEDLLKAVRAGEVDVILATEEERFARTMGDKERLEAACIAAGVTWLTVRDGEVDPATASGGFMSDVRAALGKHESRRKGERQRDANATRLGKGLPLMIGPPPFGWKPDRLTLDEPAADLIRQGIARIRSGASLPQVTREFRASGIAPPKAQAWNRISVAKVLCRWRNAGVVIHQGAVLEGVVGQWEPIASREDVEAVRAILAPGGGQKRTHSMMCSGIARCRCGETVVGSSANGQPTYQCSARIRGRAAKGSGVHSSIQANVLDAMVRKAVIDSYFIASPGALPSHDQDAVELATLYERRDDALAKIAQIQDDRESGGYTQPEFLKRTRRHRQVVDDAERQIAEHAARSAHASMLVEARASLIGDDHRVSFDDAVKFKIALGDRFDGLDLEQRRTLVAALIRITVHPGRTDDRVEIEHLGAPALDEP